MGFPGALELELAAPVQTPLKQWWTVRSSNGGVSIVFVKIYACIISSNCFDELVHKPRSPWLEELVVSLTAKMIVEFHKTVEHHPVLQAVKKRLCTF